MYQKDWSTIIKKEKKVEKKITYFDYGTLQGNQYCNTYFDFIITIPNNYKGDYKWYDLNYTTFYEADTIPVIPTLSPVSG